MSNLKIAIAGSSQYSRQMAQVLAQHPQFDITWILTPQAKARGRQQIVTDNPLAAWAQQQELTIFRVAKKIDQQLITQLKQSSIDILLVVDFGYLIPQDLLELAQLAPLNIHPSLLPKWRGSSPGQFSLLWQHLTRPYQDQVIGGSEAGISLIIMNQTLDQGDIIAQLPFTIDVNWDQSQYYNYAFQLMADQLAKHLLQLAQGQIQAQSQPIKSPTPTARQLEKDDGFVAWQHLQILMTDQSQGISSTDTQHFTKQKSQNKQLISDLLTAQGCLGHYHLTRTEQVQLVADACRALAPWPGLWTMLTIKDKAVRMKILSCRAMQGQNSYLKLESIQLEGKTVYAFKQVQDNLLT